MTEFKLSSFWYISEINYIRKLEMNFFYSVKIWNFWGKESKHIFRVDFRIRAIKRGSREWESQSAETGVVKLILKSTFGAFSFNNALEFHSFFFQKMTSERRQNVSCHSFTAMIWKQF